MPETDASPAEGLIDACSTAGCGRTCCDFGRGNYIALYPGELEATQASVAHLRIEPLEAGGHRAICRAENPADCDGGYKPLDCKSYPFFPIIDGAGQAAAGLKGKKCPLVISQLFDHRVWVASSWNALIRRSPVVRGWLRRIRLIGYRRIDE